MLRGVIFDFNGVGTQQRLDRYRRGPGAGQLFVGNFWTWKTIPRATSLSIPWMITTHAPRGAAPGACQLMSTRPSLSAMLFWLNVAKMAPSGAVNQ